MNSVNILIFILYFICLTGLPINVYNETSVIEVPKPQWTPSIQIPGNPSIFKLTAEEYKIFVSYLGYNVVSLGSQGVIPTAWITTLESHSLWQFDLKTKIFLLLIQEDKYELSSYSSGDIRQIDLARNALKNIQLENVSNSGLELKLPVLSYNEKMIACALWDVGNVAIQKSFGIWEINNGGKIISINLPINYIIEAPEEIEIRFSPSDRFLIARYAENHEATDRITEQHYEHLCYLLNTDTLELWPAHGDVAFTSDERWLVTERDGVPTLVDAETGNSIQRYDIGETNIMTAACFSPDDRQLYIAGIDRKIYVFDSHLPSRAAGWEVYP